VVRAVFDALPNEMMKGTRVLQFSPDPALDRARFERFLVSVWGGENALDMQAIALPDSSYDWIYSSHVMNHIPDDAAALREMLRVVGAGCIVLNVGGTVFSYETIPSENFMGKDRQYKVYGTMYADEVQQVLPETGVLEVVAIDPCSVSLDTVYFVSRDVAKLTAMAKLFVERNIHARIFPPKVADEAGLARARASTRPDPWRDLQRELELWRDSGAKPKFWLRDDDATTARSQLVELADLCARENVPLTLAIIPLPVTLTLIELVAKSHNLTAIQHGFDHVNRQTAPDMVKSEFPDGRDLVEAVRSVQLGAYVMKEAFGERTIPVFCPPWGTMAANVRDSLQGLNFVGFSGSRTGREIHRRSMLPAAGLRLASAHVAVNRPRMGEPLADVYILETLVSLIRAIRLEGSDEPIGIMTHHWGVDAYVRDFLKQLFDVTRATGGVWSDARTIFGVEPLPRPQSVVSPLIASA
jgi:SAM-dependent methyltransferase